jgi:hypothetical protein
MEHPWFVDGLRAYGVEPGQTVPTRRHKIIEQIIVTGSATQPFPPGFHLLERLRDSNAVGSEKGDPPRSNDFADSRRRLRDSEASLLAKAIWLRC